MKETNVLRRIQVALSAIGARVFRNQLGRYKLEDGRWLSSGLVKGSSDLIGWTPVLIRGDMVGKELAVFTAVEVKAEQGKLRKEQKEFLDVVNAAGGIGVVAHSEAEAVAKVGEFKP